ncbi:MAG: flagellar hook capping FlgD N-terminal domain-containing protein [Pirellulales bacterium]
MATVPGVGSSNGTDSTSTVKKPHSLDELGSSEFFQLIIKQLQSQDPLSPTDNDKLMQQISTIRNIGASDKLSTALSSVQTGQSMATATSMIGKTVKALADDGSEVSGVVSKLTISVDAKDSTVRTYKVQINDKSIDLKNVREVT